MAQQIPIAVITTVSGMFHCPECGAMIVHFVDDLELKPSVDKTCVCGQPYILCTRESLQDTKD